MENTINWIESKRPQANEVTVYAISWIATLKVGNAKRTEMAFRNKALAESVYRNMAASGKEPIATIQHVRVWF